MGFFGKYLTVNVLKSFNTPFNCFLSKVRNQRHTVNTSFEVFLHPNAYSGAPCGAKCQPENSMFQKTQTQKPNQLRKPLCRLAQNSIFEKTKTLEQPHFGNSHDPKVGLPCLCYFWRLISIYSENGIRAIKI
jgi:hypothetical protein